MKPKAFIIIGGTPKEFADIQEAEAYAKEHCITNIKVINVDAQSLMFKPRIPMFAPMSGQENRRARRAAERAKRKKK